MVPITVRPFSEADFPTFIALVNRTEPDQPWSVDEARAMQDAFASGGYLWLRWLAIAEDGEVVGAASLSHLPHQFHPRRFRMGVRVDPE